MAPSQTLEKPKTSSGVTHEVSVAMASARGGGAWVSPLASTPARVDTRLGLVQRVSRLARGQRAAGYEGRGAGVVAEDPRWVRGFGRRRPMDGGGARVRGSGGAAW